MNKQIELKTAIRSSKANLKEFIPAVVYGGKSQNQLVEIDTKTIERVFHTNAFHTHVINLIIDNKKTPVLLKDWQLNAISRKVTHMDFFRITANNPVDIDVPVRVIGEDQCTAITDEKGVLQLHMTEISSQCLPKDIPEHIDVDISNLALKESIHASDLTAPSGVTFNIQIDETHNPTILSIQPPIIEEVEEVEEVEEEMIADEAQVEAKEANNNVETTTETKDNESE